MSVETAVFLQSDQVRPIEVEGRQLLVPMIAFNALYGWGGDLESNALDVHIHNLRRKLWPGVIRTVRGVGYVADAPE